MRAPLFRNRRLGIALAIAAAMSGCSTVDFKRQVVEETKSMRKGPEDAPAQSITNFSTALRCMDNLFIEYGVRDLSVLVEDLQDQTKKVNAGTKDMLISAVSQMTIRSKAVRLVIYGSDSGNLISILREAQRRHPYASLPEFDIKGSVSQLDENVARRQGDIGIGFNQKYSVGAAKSASTSVLALDLTMLTTHDLSVVPGVTSRNAVAIFKDGSGVDGDAQIRKFGINFNLTLAKSEGQAQALRTLVELAAIELFGKLTRIPYWKCLGSSDADEAVKGEIGDWFHAMLGDREDMVRYFQNQLRVRGLYKGPVDGAPNPELADAVAAYREALGLEKNYKVDLAFFTAYLKAKHADPVATIVSKGAPQPTAAPAGPLPPVPLAQAAAQNAPLQPLATAVPPAPISVTVTSTDRKRVFRAGEPIRVSVATNRDVHVTCYLQDEDRKLVRFFPNRFQRDSLVRANQPLVLPGAGKYQLVANTKAQDEVVACFAAESDVLPHLPQEAAGREFEALPLKTINQVAEAFALTTRNSFGTGTFLVQVK